MQSLVMTLFLVVATAGCNTNLRVGVSGASCADDDCGERPTGLRIELVNPTVSTPDVTVAWKSADDEALKAKDAIFDLVVAKDETCNDPILLHRNIADFQKNITLERDGFYYLCLTAKVRGKEFNAENNGIALTLDREAPVLSLTFTNALTDKPLHLDPEVRDLTTLNYEWKKVSGSGDALFSNPAIRDPTVPFSAKDVYVVQLTVTDAAGNQSSQNITIDWDTTIPLVTLTGAPTGITNLFPFTANVGGNGLTHYKYKITNSVSCEDNAPYGPEIDASTPLINDTAIALGDGQVRLCVIGKNRAGTWQSEATAALWIVDTTPPIALLNNQPADPSTTTILDITIVGADVDTYRYKVGPATIDCADPVDYNGPIAVATKITDNIAAMADSALKLCVVGLDHLGNQQAYAAATTTTWTKDTTPPTATLSNQPADPSAATILDVTVAGADVVTYRYKFGLATIDCANSAGYSSFVAVATKITDSIAGLADGALKLCVVGLDALGNQQTYAAATTATWTKDTTPPTATLSNQPTNPSAATSLDITVAGADVVAYHYKVGSTTIDCADSADYDGPVAIATKITDNIAGLADGALKLCVVGLDNLDNQQAYTAATTITWTKDTTPPVPVLSNTPNALDKRTSFSVTVTAANGLSEYKYKYAAAADIDCTQAAGYSGPWIAQTTPIAVDVSGAADGNLRLCVIGRDALANTQGFADATTLTWLKDTVVGSVTSLTITPTPVTTTPGVTINVSATDSGTNVTHLCFIVNNATKPQESHDCWITVELMGTTPGLNISVSNYPFLLNYSPGSQTVYAWMKDAVGNISNLSAAGAGTSLVDKAATTFDPGTPPLVKNVFVGNTDALNSPPSMAQQQLIPGNAAYIKWHASDAEGLSAQPISIYYSTDNVNFTLIADNLENGVNGSCTIGGGTGCYEWAAGVPSTGYHIVRVMAKDTISQTKGSLSNAINSTPLNILAGNTDTGVNASASAAVFQTDETYPVTLADPHSLVAARNGTIYFRDKDSNLLYISPTDGILRRLVPTTGTATNGNINTATMRQPLAIAIDHQDRLLVYDYDRIRRFNFDQNPVTVETIIGGGASTASSAPALDVKITFPGGVSSWNFKEMPFIVTSNGTIYFYSEFTVNQTTAEGYRVRVYDPDTGTVSSISPSGTGHEGNPAQDITLCRNDRFGMA